jgi:DNA (cytosine-5)-methyltransferase 1
LQVRPRLLDLFAGAGGCSVGYDRAGFDVTGVDIEPHDDYPFEFIAADAMQVLTDSGFLDTFDAIHASPPCQAYSSISPAEHDHPDLIEPVRTALLAWGGPFVIENVEGSPLPGALRLCGSEFGLGAMCKDGKWRQLRRHRRFESNTWLMGAGGCHHKGQALGVYGHGGGQESAHGYSANAAEASEAMGIDWMRHHDVVQAIPPAYTEFIGEQLIEQLERAAA